MKFCLIGAAVATLLVCCLAYAVPFTVTVVPTGGTVPCDIGPPYIGTIPSAATQAGFTHCAANYDFTQTQSFTDALGTHQWSNLSSWLYCFGPTTSAPYIFFFWGNVPCDAAHIKITTDSGVQVLAMTYYLTDAQSGNYDHLIVGNGNSLGGSRDPLPSQYYTEMTIRLSAAQTSNNFYILFDTSSLTAVQGNPCYVASDQEFDSFPSATGVGLAIYNPACGTGGVTGTNGAINSSVNTYGKLITADNVSKFAGCNYYSAGAVAGLPASAFGSCVAITVVPPSTRDIFNVNLYEYIEEGPFHNSVGANWDLPSHTTYIQRKTIWTCSGYATGACINNPVITSAP